MAAISVCNLARGGQLVLLACLLLLFLLPCKSAAAASFSLDNCRKDRPNLCALAQNSSSSSAGICRVDASSGGPTASCRNTGLGERIPWMLCNGGQTLSAYNAAVSVNDLPLWVQNPATYFPALEECTNLACKLAKQGCVTDGKSSAACWGTVVELDVSYPTAAASKAFLGSPCLESPSNEKTGSKFMLPTSAPVSPKQQFVQGPWQACNCSTPTVNASDPVRKAFAGLDDAIAFLAEQLLWAAKCNSTSLPKAYKDYYCSPVAYGSKPTQLLNLLLNFLVSFRTLVTSPNYAKSSLKAAMDSLEGFAASISKAFASFAASPAGQASELRQQEFWNNFGRWWCANANLAPWLFMPLVLVFPPLALPLFMSFDSC